MHNPFYTTQQNSFSHLSCDCLFGCSLLSPFNHCLHELGIRYVGLDLWMKAEAIMRQRIWKQDDNLSPVFNTHLKLLPNICSTSPTTVSQMQALKCERMRCNNNAASQSSILLWFSTQGSFYTSNKACRPRILTTLSSTFSTLSPSACR